MRALLINPWIYDFAAYDLWSKPLGLLNIASHLRRLGFDISLVDCLDRLHPALKRSNYKTPGSGPYGSGQYHSDEIEKPDIYKTISRAFKRYGLPKALFEDIISQEPDPDIILVTTGMTYWYPACTDIIGLLKKRFSAPVLIGGNYVNLSYWHAKNFSGADMAYKGAEIFDVTRLICDITGFDADYSLLLKDHDRLFPAYELYDSLEYATLRTSNGCPFRCTYCGWYLADDSFNRREASTVLDEISYLHDELGVNNFSFYDEALLYDAQSHIKKILEGIVKNKIGASFHTPNGMHSRFLTEELAALMKSAGFVKPRIALETIDPERQAETGAKTTNEEFLSALDSLKKAGYRSGDIGVYILAGLPGQSEPDIEMSIRFAAGQGVRVFLEEYSPIPGTPDYKKTGLPEDADPLLHNNNASSIRALNGSDKLQRLKTLAHGFNSTAGDDAGAVGR